MTQIQLENGDGSGGGGWCGRDVNPTKLTHWQLTRLRKKYDQDILKSLQYECIILSFFKWPQYVWSPSQSHHKCLTVADL